VRCAQTHTLLLSVSQMPHRTHTPLVYLYSRISFVLSCRKGIMSNRNPVATGCQTLWWCDDVCSREQLWSLVRIDYISQNGWPLMLVFLYRLVWTTVSLHLVVSVLQLWWFSQLNYYHLSYIYTHQSQNKITPSTMSALINRVDWIHMNAKHTDNQIMTWCWMPLNKSSVVSLDSWYVHICITVCFFCFKEQIICT